MDKILKNQFFWLGLFIRFFLILLVYPLAEKLWYIPFLNFNSHNFTIDPWGNYLSHGGDSLSFPYGLVMFYYFFPFIKFATFFNLNSSVFYGLALLSADILLMVILYKISRVDINKIINYYWLSPIVIFASYWGGFNDLVPLVFLYSGLYCLAKNFFIRSGLLIGFAISAKFSMVLALPFIFIFLVRNKVFNHNIKFFLYGTSCSFLLFGFPFLISNSGLSMLINNPEMSKVYNLVMHFDGNFNIYVVPAIYLLVTYFSWSIGRQSFEMLYVLIGVSFFIVILFASASPGWFLWVVPVILLYQSKQGKHAEFLGLFFSLIYFLFGIAIYPWPILNNSILSFMFDKSSIPNLIDNKTISIMHTIIFSLGLVLVIRIVNEMIFKSNFFKFTRKPIVIGIAGDSGAGKDTLALGLTNIFGAHSTVTLSGDDYHNWDRNKPMWQVMTHLNPQANQIQQYHSDLIGLTSGKSVMVRHYDHSSGKLSRPYKLNSNHFIITSGLHALHLPSLRNCHDLSVFLDIDENLRRYFKLKRDVIERGYDKHAVLASLSRREIDSERFIKPQAEFADLKISLQPVHLIDLDNLQLNRPLKLKLVVSSLWGMQQESLFRVLVGICGLHVDMEFSPKKNEVVMVIEGDVLAEDIELAAQKTLSPLIEILDLNAKWEDGIRGLMQLIVLTFINQSFKERLVC